MLVFCIYTVDIYKWYMLLYVIQGSDSFSGPYIRVGAHPPPRRHRPRVQAKLTHNQATGFPGDHAGAPLVGGHCADVLPLAAYWSEVCRLKSKMKINENDWSARTPNCFRCLRTEGRAPYEVER